jgi:hypothetical protein
MPTFSRLLFTLALGALSCKGTTAYTNGDFETGDFNGWTANNWFIDTTNPQSGSFDAATGCVGSPWTDTTNVLQVGGFLLPSPVSAYILQDVPTIIGRTYTLSFYYDSGQFPQSGSELLVQWGDPTSTRLSTVVDLVNIDTGGGYLQYSGTVIATSLLSRLEFLGRQDIDFYFVDNVTLDMGAPEPGSLSLLVCGLICLFTPSGYQWFRGHSRERTKKRVSPI